MNKLLFKWVPALAICFFVAGGASGQSQTDTVKSFYTGQPKRLKEWYVKNDSFPGKIHGLYTSYYESGNLKAKGNYVAGSPQGQWKYFYENGSLKTSAYFEKGKATGYHTYYYESGCPSGEGVLEDGVRQGTWKFYYENCKLKKQGELKDDNPTGLWKYYYEDGKSKAIANFTESGGYYKEFYANGNAKAEGKVVGGKSDSIWIYYYPNGTKKAEGHETAGLKNGLWRYYHLSGKIASEGYYANGKSTGFWKYFSDTGELTAEGPMDDGQKNGFWKLYYAGGKLRGEGNFTKGDGKYTEYYENGKLKLTGTIKDGKNDGEWVYYDEEGNREGICRYTKGIGNYSGYYPTGQLKMEGVLEDGKKTGTWTLYKEEGGIAGYLKTVYEKEKTRPDTPEEGFWGNDRPASEENAFNPVNENRNEKPEQTSPGIKIHRRRHIPKYFIAKEFEYRSLIVGGNPVALIFNNLPIYIEHYNQERLGHEFIFTYFKNPLTGQLSNIDNNKVMQTGKSIAIKQKFYSDAGKSGMIYFAHELRYSNFFYESKLTPGGLPVTNPADIRMANGVENLYEYSVLIGDRFIRYPGRSGFTVDIFIGMGIGYRDFRKSENTADYSRVFSNVTKNQVSIPIRFGFSIGYMF